MRRRLALCLAALLAAAVPPAVSETPQRLRVVGGLAQVPQYVRIEEPFWTTELPKLTGGRLAAEIVPFDRAGIQPQEMLRLVQLGVVSMGTVLLSTVSSDMELMAIDLAGLNPDMPTLRRSVDAFRPHLAKVLRERYGAELLAVHVYPAQVTWCRQPFASFADLAGRRVRVSGTSQHDFVTALGGKPVQIPFAQVASNMAAGSVDCAITGAMSGNSVGLHEVASFVGGVPLSWGVSAFVANGRTWAALGAPTQALLKRELAVLEQTIWADASVETGNGIACNTGDAACRQGRRGSMKEVRGVAEDQRRRREIFAGAVLPEWIRRCGSACAEVWRQTLGPAHDIAPR